MSYLLRLYIIPCILYFNFKPMPVKKKTPKGVKVSQKKESGCFSCYSPSMTSTGREFCSKLFITFIGVILVYFIVFLATLIRNNIREYNFIGYADRIERSITVEAQAKVTATPDIAVTTVGMISEGATVAEAQAQNSKVMNSLIQKLETLGVDKLDLQTTNYNIYPLYNYTEDEGRILRGYEVNQQVKVKIRNLDNAQKVLAMAGEVGANNVSGLNFTIDDRDVYKAQARELALQKIAVKAKSLSNSLGVNMIGVVSYNEYESTDGPVQFRTMAMMEGGIGGGVAPQIESGSMDVVMNVNVVFEIR